MHNTTYNRMSEFVLAYLHGKPDLRILDVGSYDVNGTYRAIFTGEPEPADRVRRDPKEPEPEKYIEASERLAKMDRSQWVYVGMDIREGPNVDIPMEDPEIWPLENAAFDVIVSGQTLEHVARPECWAFELSRVLRPGGLACVIAPWKGDIHYRPHYWLIMPDGMRFLMETIGGLEVLKCFVEQKDCIGIARKTSGETMKSQADSGGEAHKKE